eukprot:gene28699-34647_t
MNLSLEHNAEIDDEEDDVAVEKVASWYLHVHIHEKLITVACGDANQKVKWLAHVAIARWDEKDSQGWTRLGIPLSVHLNSKDGEEVDMNKKICEVLSNGDHVFVDSSLSPTLTR